MRRIYVDFCTEKLLNFHFKSEKEAAGGGLLERKINDLETTAKLYFSNKAREKVQM